METSRARAVRHRRSERGATLVEYALLVAVFVIPAGVGLQHVQAGAEDKFGHVATNVANPRETTTTTAAPTTTTTTAPTTTAAPTTTTTTTTTSTTATPTKLQGTWGSGTGTPSGNNGNKKWYGSSQITVKNSSTGAAVSGATVTVSVKLNYYNGTSSAASDLSGSTSASGKFTFESSNYAWTNSTSSSTYVKSITFTIKSITKSGLTWDGNAAAVTASKPSSWSN